MGVSLLGFIFLVVFSIHEAGSVGGWPIRADRSFGRDVAQLGMGARLLRSTFWNLDC